MAQILINDILDDFKDENQNIFNDLELSQKRTEFLQNYRKLLIEFRAKCVCNQNKPLINSIESLETQYKQLFNELNGDKSEKTIETTVVKSEDIFDKEVISEEKPTKLVQMLDTNINVFESPKLKKRKFSTFDDSIESEDTNNQIIILKDNNSRKASKVMDTNTSSQEYGSQEKLSTSENNTLRSIFDKMIEQNHIQKVALIDHQYLKTQPSLTSPPISSVYKSSSDGKSNLVLVYNKQNNAFVDKCKELLTKPTGISTQKSIQPTVLSTHKTSKSCYVVRVTNGKITKMNKVMPSENVSTFRKETNICSDDQRNDNFADKKEIKTYLRQNKRQYFQYTSSWNKTSKPIINVKPNQTIHSNNNNNNKPLIITLDLEKTSPKPPIRTHFSSKNKIYTVKDLRKACEHPNREIFTDARTGLKAIRLKFVNQENGKISFGPKMGYKCNYPECTFFSSSSTKTRQHENSHTIGKAFGCDICGKKFTTVSGRWIHKNQVHNAFNRPLIPCKYPGCNFKSHTDNQTQMHYITHQSERNIECDVCGKRFKTTHQMKAHRKRHTDQKPFTCDWPGCEYRGKILESLKHHLKYSHPEYTPTTIPCEYPGCDFKARNSSRLRRHSLRHSDERPFQCDQIGCDKRFKNTKDLSNHKLSCHSDERPYACEWPDCDYRCKIKGNLGHHKKIHLKK